jgi:hypothetical protein
LAVAADFLVMAATDDRDQIEKLSSARSPDGRMKKNLKIREKSCRPACLIRENKILGSDAL